MDRFAGVDVDPVDPTPGLRELSELARRELGSASRAAAILLDSDGAVLAWAGAAESAGSIEPLAAAHGRRHQPIQVSVEGASALWVPIVAARGARKVIAGALILIGEAGAGCPDSIAALAAAVAPTLAWVVEVRAAWFRRDRLTWSGLRRITGQWLHTAAIRGEPVCVALLAVEGLAELNRSRDSRAADAAARAAAEAIVRDLPDGQFFARLPGAISATVSTQPGAADRLAEIVRAVDPVLRREHGVGLRLGHAGCDEPAGIDAALLVRRAAAALDAARSGGNPIQAWQPALDDVEPPPLGDLDELQSPAYHRFATIWRLFDVFTGGSALDELLSQTVDAVASVPRADRSSLWTRADDGEWHRRFGDREDPHERELVFAAVEAGEPAVRALDNGAALAVPMPSAPTPLAALYFEGGALQTGRETLSFLSRLGDQIGKVLSNRATLEQAIRRQRDSEVRLRAEARELRRMLRTRVGLLGSAPTLVEVRRRIGRAAATTVPVLISGETGTGKEVAARMIHRQSRREGPFVVVDCGGIPGTLLESELFGHEKGAFTGADSRKLGRFEQAQGGTLFLDEIGELPLELQPKLLRVLQESTIRRVGGAAEIPLDFRLVAATHRDLRHMVDDGTFREDLYFRLRVIEVEIPPLRERGDDVLLLAYSFLRDYCGEMSRELVPLTTEAEQRLVAYSWPGNVRELQNVLRRAVAMAPGTELTADDLQVGSRPVRPTPTPARARPAPGAAVAELTAGARGEWPGELVADWLWDGWSAESEPPSPIDAVQSLVMRALLATSDGNLARVGELLNTSAATVTARLRRLAHPQLARSLRAHPFGVELERRARAAESDGAAAALIEELEEVILRELFVYCRGNKSSMARLLGWSRHTLARRLHDSHV